ncbi:MAG: hypothetical protein ACRENT_07375 [Thermodesulfobacteriota bacterium]
MNKNESVLKTETGKHLETFLYRVPKKNHDAVVKNLKKFVPWLEGEGVRLEYYRFGEGEIMEGMESIAKTLSAADDEEIWMELQYFRDLQHCKDVYSKMIQDKTMEPIGTEFFGLITKGKPLVTGGFRRLE